MEAAHSDPMTVVQSPGEKARVPGVATCNPILIEKWIGRLGHASVIHISL